MRAGIAVLTIAYAFSQFYRAFLAVLAPALAVDIGATAEDLAFASGIWFAVFAAMQVPVGYALDHLGPRRTSGGLFLAAAAGAALFATADGPGRVVVAMALIGVGCAPILMSAFYIFARTMKPAAFASLGGILIGVSSAGNVASAAPMAWAATEFGWRPCLWALAAVSLLTAVGLLVLVRDPGPAPQARSEADGLRSVLRTPALLLLLPLTLVHYAPVGGVRGLWAGPYLHDVFGLGTEAVGQAVLAMGVAMILGNFAYGPLDRMLGTRKAVLLGGNLLLAAALLALAAWPSAGAGTAILLLCAVGFLGSTFPVMIAHGRSYFPAHLAGRGVTLLNLLAIGGAGLAQIGSGALFGAVQTARPQDVAAPFAAIFLMFGLLIVAGLVPYLFSHDRLD